MGSSAPLNSALESRFYVSVGPDGTVTLTPKSRLVAGIQGAVEGAAGSAPVQAVRSVLGGLGHVLGAIPRAASAIGQNQAGLTPMSVSDAAIYGRDMNTGQEPVSYGTALRKVGFGEDDTSALGKAAQLAGDVVEDPAVLSGAVGGAGRALRGASLEESIAKSMQRVKPAGKFAMTRGQKMYPGTFQGDQAAARAGLTPAEMKAEWAADNPSLDNALGVDARIRGRVAEPVMLPRGGVGPVPSEAPIPVRGGHWDAVDSELRPWRTQSPFREDRILPKRVPALVETGKPALMPDIESKFKALRDLGLTDEAAMTLLNILGKAS